jgi:hypothetical protein
MAKGHLDQTWKNQRSTKPAPTVIPTNDGPVTVSPTAFPDNNPPLLKARTQHIYAATSDPTGQIYSYQTGRFVTTSSNGNNCMMAVYDYDSNHIFIQPFRNRTAKFLLGAFKLIHTRLVNAGLRPQLHQLNNTCSETLKHFLHAKSIKFQLVPPDVCQEGTSFDGFKVRKWDSIWNPEWAHEWTHA